MQDRIPVNPGRVLITPENGSAAYYATMARADNPTQEGTPLNKASLLKDATANKFGLGVDAVPDDAFSLLSRFHSGLGNEYLWAKYAVQTVDAYDTQKFQGVQVNTNANDFYYSASFHIANSLFVLDNPTKISWAYPDDLSDLAGKYCIKGGKATSGDTLYLMVQLPTKYSTSINCDNATVYSNIHNEDVETLVGYVNNPDPSAYPIDDGYTYKAWGQLGKAFDGIKYASGTYEATGTYGTNNPCSLTFDFVPKILAIAVQYSSNNQSNSQVFVLPKPSGNTENKGGSCSISTWEYTKKVYTYASADGKTVYWYSPDSATHQMNQSGFTYAYFAIG